MNPNKTGDGEVCTYTYGTNNLLTSAQDIDGYKLSCSYNIVTTGKPARISRIEESHNGVSGRLLNIEYAHNQTVFTDHNGNTEILQFNNWGNTVCIQDGQGRAQYAQYATDTDAANGKSNQLRLASKLQNTVGNYLKNSSFESGSLWTANTSTVSVSRSTEAAYNGSYSMRTVSSETSDTHGAYSHEFFVAQGQTVTFSAYVKTLDASASISLHYFDTSTNQYICLYSPTVTPGQDWTRTEVSYTNTTGGTLKMWVYFFILTPGTAYIDCAQVENAPTASRYNLVENGDFRYGDHFQHCQHHLRRI